MIPENWTGTHTPREFQITNCGVPFSENICLFKTHFSEVRTVAKTHRYQSEQSGSQNFKTLFSGSLSGGDRDFGHTLRLTLKQPAKVEWRRCRFLSFLFFSPLPALPLFGRRRLNRNASESCAFVNTQLLGECKIHSGFILSL